jgi:hypothetical protein
VCDGFWVVALAPSPKLHPQLVGPPVDASLKATVSGASPAVGVPVKSGVGAAGSGGEPLPPISACQYWSVVLLLASTTTPLAAVTFCFVDVTSLSFSAPVSSMTTSPIPAAKSGALSDVDLRTIVPPDCPCVAKTSSRSAASSISTIGRVWLLE